MIFGPILAIWRTTYLKSIEYICGTCVKIRIDFVKNCQGYFLVGSDTFYRKSLLWIQYFGCRGFKYEIGLNILMEAIYESESIFIKLNIHRLNSIYVLKSINLQIQCTINLKSSEYINGIHI